MNSAPGGSTQESLSAGKVARAGETATATTPLSIPFALWLASVTRGAPLDSEDNGVLLDTVVIGSGYGGSVAALRMVEKGYSVVLLERGSEYLPGDFPNDIGQLPKFQRLPGRRGPMGRATGLFDWHAGPGVASLVANGLGGGSLINAGVMMRPDDDVFAQPAWPDAIRLHSDLPARSLDSAFATAERELRPQPFRHFSPQGDPVDLPKTQALKWLGQALTTHIATRQYPVHIGSASVTIALDKCTRCGDCVTGCNVPGAKQTLRDSYLQQAHAAGAVLVSGALVWTLEPQDDGTWSLRCIATERSGHRASVNDAALLDGATLRARRVVIAAGTFGSTELLQRSKARFGERFELSPTLGSRLSANGDSISASADEVDPVHGLGHGAQTLPDAKPDAANPAEPKPVGPTITTMIDLRRRPELHKRLVIQDCATPGALVRACQEVLATTWVINHIGAKWREPRHAGSGTNDPLGAPRVMAEHAQLLLTMGHDESQGRIVWVDAMDASVPYWVRPEEADTYKHQEAVFKAIDAMGAKYLPAPPWRPLPESARAALNGPLPEPTLLTVHPLGGCAMGDSFDGGVVDDQGRVWKGPNERWPTLWVLDGAIVPTSLGCNPLWTITALAERAMAFLPEIVGPPRPMPARQPLPQPVPREPQALRRGSEPAFDVRLSERLEQPELPLRGALRAALGAKPVQADLRVHMRAPDWSALWDTSRHSFADVSGRLRLVAANGSGRLSYRICGGEVELLPYDRPWPVIGPVLHLLAVLRALLTWLILRGWRELRTTFRDEGFAGLWKRLTGSSSMLRIWGQAAVPRTMRYELTLELIAPRAGADRAAAAPATLALFGSKQVRYAATCGQLLRHVSRHIWSVLRGRAPPSPGELRPAYLDQITRPEIRLVAAGPLARWRAALPWGVTRARFAFDMQAVFQRSPVALLQGGDTSSAMLSLLAYPALLVRHALQTHMLDFRLPDYSGKPVRDVGAPDEVALRAQHKGRPDIHPERFTVTVRRGRSSSDDGDEDPSNIDLPLWRYRRVDGDGRPLPPEVKGGSWHGLEVRRAKSVLLMHAFGMSGSTFTFKTKTNECNLAEYLHRQGYEVWILDTRMSPRVAGSQRQGTIDQVGLIDTPAAVDFILGVLQGKDELGPGEPLQIFSFAHCMGAAGMLIALLDGKLSHPEFGVPAAGDDGDAQAPQLPKLAGLVCSQVHPFMVGSRKSQAKTWVATLVRDVLHRTLLPLAVRGPVNSVLESFTDRVFASMPVPEGERCPDEGRYARLHDDDCATCRRIRFIDGELFRHGNLSRETHEALPRLFGDANVRLFAHGARTVDYERLVNEDGLNAYVTEETITRYLGLPLRFVHGALNDLFDKESATRSAGQLARLQPRWSAQFAVPGKGSTADLIEGYGHLDLLIGEGLAVAPQSGDSVYQRLTGLFDQVLSVPQQPAKRPPAAELATRVCFPKVGPWVGPVMGADGKRKIRIAFVVDDMQSDVAPAQDALDASAIVHGLPGAPEVVPLQIEVVRMPLVATDGYRLSSPRRDAAATATDGVCAVRVAHGDITVPPGTGRLRIEAVSHSEVARGSSRKKASLELATLRTAIDEAERQARLQREEAAQPFAPTLSQLRLQPVRPQRRWVHLREQMLATLGPQDEVRIALGSCRYPGFPFDRQRADQSFACLLRRVRGDPVQRPHLGVMLGDQIYADATAGFLDPLSGVERYVKRHADAFGTPALQRLMAQLPMLLTPDDHEFIDGYPNGPPLFKGSDRREAYANLRSVALRDAARRALSAFQKMTQPKGDREAGSCAVELGAVRCMVMDTRSEREMVDDPRNERPSAAAGQVRMLTEAQRKAISAWLEQGRDGHALHVLCNGSVIWPPLLSGSDPANTGASDTWQDAPNDREWLMEELIQHVPGRFVVVAGDYHLSFGGLLELDGQTVGACIVAPPFYAPLPYANSRPCHLDLGAELELPSGRLRLQNPGEPVCGSGYAVLAARRQAAGAPGATGWSLRLDTEQIDMDAGGEWGGLTTRARWSL